MKNVYCRPQFYQLTVPVVPPDGVVGVPLQLDTDAPFYLSWVKSRNVGLSGFRFQTPRKLYQSNALRTDWIVPIGAGAPAQSGRGLVIRPTMAYPVGAQIVCDIGNNTGANIENARLLFRGWKLFSDRAMLSPTYPPKFSTLPFHYPTIVQNVGLASSATQPFTLLDNQLRIRQDADFVYRYGVADPFVLGVEGGTVGFSRPDPTQAADFSVPLVGTISEVYVVLRDESRKPYMNEPIHINDVFGQGVPTPGGDNTSDQRVLFFPGLMDAEIYLPAEHSLYFDLFRFDTTGYPTDLHFRFGGAKVFHRS